MIFFFPFLKLHNTAEVHREVAIRCLVVYLGEKEEDLFTEFSVNNSTCQMNKLQALTSIRNIVYVRNPFSFAIACSCASTPAR